MPLDVTEVYRVRCDEDGGGLIGLDAKVRHGHLTWFDTYRDRGMPIRDQREEGDTMVFETPAGHVYRFVPLTKAIYDREVRAAVELAPEFSDTGELKAFYRDKFLGADVEEK